MSTTRDHMMDTLAWKNQVLWLALSFHAGFLNAGGFLACHRFVSHMTGFGTQIGLSISISHYLVAFEYLLAPVSFISGAVFAAYLVDRDFHGKISSRLLFGLSCILVLNAVVLIGGLTGYFGVFGEPLLLQRDFILLFILTFVCGLQNGLFSSLTSNQIRTTHITGLTTDIGLSFVRIFYEKSGAAKEVQKQKNYLRIRTFVAFSSGSLAAAIIFNKVGYWGFLGSTVISLGILYWVYYLIRIDPGKVRGEQGI